jgi:hypothetical protein
MQAGDVEMKEAESPMITPHPTLHPATRITLPRNLTRPPYREVSKAAIGAVDPDLEDTDLEYIREGLAEFGHGYVFLHLSLTHIYIPTPS